MDTLWSTLGSVLIEEISSSKILNCMLENVGSFTSHKLERKELLKTVWNHGVLNHSK